MKLNRILLVVLIASISQVATASEIYKGKIISEKMWADNGGKVKLINTKFRSEHKHGYIFVDAFIESQKAAVNAATSVAGNSQTDVMVQNTSDKEQSYFVRQTVCAELDDHNMHCLHRYIDLELEPSGYFSDNALPDMSVIHNTPGVYKINVESGVLNFNHSNSTFANAEGYVVVS